MPPRPCNPSGCGDVGGVGPTCRGRTSCAGRVSYAVVGLTLLLRVSRKEEYMVKVDVQMSCSEDPFCTELGLRMDREQTRLVLAGCRRGRPAIKPFL